MDTSYSIRLGIEDQAAVEKAFAAIGEAGKTALATVQGAAGSASDKLGKVSDGAWEIAGGFDVVSTSATGLPMVAAKALAPAEATENVATALRTAGGVAGVASEALGLLTESQEDQAAAAQGATDDIAALAAAQMDLTEAQDDQAEATQAVTDDIREMAAAQADLEEQSGTSLTTILAWAAGIAAVAGIIYLAYKTVESAGNYAALIGGKIGLGDGWEPAIATTTGSEAISPDLIAAIERLQEAYDPAIAESKKYRAEIDLVTEALRKLPTEAAGPLQELKEKIEAAYFAASADGKTMAWIQTLVDKAKPAKTEADLLTEALEKLDGLLDSDLIDVKRYQEWGDALRGALDKARQGAKDATAEFDRLKTSLTEQLYAIGRTQAEILRFRLENARTEDGQPKYTATQVDVSHAGRRLIASRNSNTSTGHSGQLCSQQITMSQPRGSWPWSRKLRLLYSNSTRTRSQRSGPTRRFASQSGNPVWTLSTA